MLGQVSKPLGDWLLREEMSRDDPTVVTELPGRPGRPTMPAPHPALQHLPRP